MRRGRPSKALDPQLVAHLLDLRRAGIGLEDAARLAGVHPTRVRAWLRSAWNPDPAAAVYVAFARRWIEADVLARADEDRMRQFEEQLRRQPLGPFELLGPD